MREVFEALQKAAADVVRLATTQGVSDEEWESAIDRLDNAQADVVPLLPKVPACVQVPGVTQRKLK